MTLQEAINILAKSEQHLYKNIDIYGEYYHLASFGTEDYRSYLKQRAADTLKKIRKEKLNKICQKYT